MTRNSALAGQKALSGVPASFSRVFMAAARARQPPFRPKDCAGCSGRTAKLSDSGWGARGEGEKTRVLDSRVPSRRRGAQRHWLAQARRVRNRRDQIRSRPSGRLARPCRLQPRRTPASHLRRTSGQLAGSYAVAAPCEWLPGAAIRARSAACQCHSCTRSATDSCGKRARTAAHRRSASRSCLRGCGSARSRTPAVLDGRIRPSRARR